MVGSYPRPLWFTHQLAGRDVLEAFKVAAHQEAFHDATRTVIKDQEQAGLDILTDGQMWFDDYHMGIGSFLWYWLERTSLHQSRHAATSAAVDGRSTRSGAAVKSPRKPRTMSGYARPCACSARSRGSAEASAASDAGAAMRASGRRASSSRGSARSAASAPPVNIRAMPASRLRAPSSGKRSTVPQAQRLR
jgi:hypothetical protein